jgi:hypothetical protein
LYLWKSGFVCIFFRFLVKFHTGLDTLQDSKASDQEDMRVKTSSHSAVRFSYLSHYTDQVHARRNGKDSLTETVCGWHYFKDLSGCQYNLHM